MDRPAHARWFPRRLIRGALRVLARPAESRFPAARPRGARPPGGTPSFLRRLIAAVQRRMRPARWHLQSAIRARRVRAESRPADGTGGEYAIVFDLRGYNPIGWRRAARGAAGALGSPRRLPPGVEARRVHRRALRRLRRFHHLEDVSAFHPDAAARAGALARLAAAGVLVRVADGDRRLQPLLGNGLYRMMATDMSGLDADAREQLGIRMRRAALREHSSWARARRQGEEEFPLVSILLATKRPGFLPWALANVARQTWPRVELVLALHGAGFAEVEPRVAELPHPAKVLRAPASEPLGAVLDAAVEASSGTLLTKMDDDDAYGADHLWDLVLAREYSGAQLVGKWLEFVYLSASNRTIRWFHGRSERYQASVLAGGTLLVSRRDLDGAGGWRRAPQGVDTALAADVLQAGGRVYRTHAAGFMMVRHGCRHTWNDRDGSDDSFLARADRVWFGFQPDRAGIEAPGIPYPAPAAADGSTAMMNRRRGGAGACSGDPGASAPVRVTERTRA